MDRILEHIKSWCMGYVLLILMAICAIKGRFDAVLGGLKVIGWLIGIGLMCGIPLFIISAAYRVIRRKWSKIGKVLYILFFLTVAMWLFYGSVLSFIDVKNIRSGAYVTSESGEEWLASKSLLKRQEICSGIGLFLLGGGTIWVCWMGLKKGKEQHINAETNGFDQGLNNENE